MSDEAGPLAVPIYVRHYRKLKGMTQERLADAAGLSTTSVHNLEAGKNGFSDKSLRQIASALELQPHELLTPPGAMIDSDPAILAFILSFAGGHRLIGNPKRETTRDLSLVNAEIQHLRSESEHLAELFDTSRRTGD